ncbi:MAG TPA: isopentenyl phosphate kinase [Candidatus Nitrosotenuis sp.]|nr:isopentenyl phosphate kinase [Candidatus Nitrosotenuis sp.]
MILIKLGGSIITNKERPLSPRIATVQKIAQQLKKIKEPLAIVHGGGSFGHYWSVKYDMHTKPANYDLHGVSVVKNSMVELNKIVLDCLERAGLNPYCLPPTDFMSGNKPISSKIRQVKRISKAGLIPVTFGDALWFAGRKSYILSGDKIMSLFAKVLRPRLCVFVLNVDGLYSDLKTKELIYEMKGNKVSVDEIPMDVTGGMKRKIQEAAAISKMGLNVFFVNGNKPQRIVDAVQKAKFEGTLFRGR